MKKLIKKAVVLHSGGMDSSLCLALAIQEFGRDQVLSLSIKYGQRHSTELKQALRISHDWGVDHVELPLDCLKEITHNALIDHQQPIIHQPGQAPNTLVAGRNGLMTYLAAIHAHHLGARCIYLGVIEVEQANSGYRDCSRDYMNLVQTLLRRDFDDQNFEIRTPLVNMTKKETLVLGYQLGILEYLLQETISCYEGMPYEGCQTCPACHLRNDGIREFLIEYPDFLMPYSSHPRESL